MSPVLSSSSFMLLKSLNQEYGVCCLFVVHDDVWTRQIRAGKESGPVWRAASRCVRALAAASEWESRVLLHKETLSDISYLRKSQKLSLRTAAKRLGPTWCLDPSVIGFADLHCLFYHLALKDKTFCKYIAWFSSNETIFVSFSIYNTCYCLKTEQKVLSKFSLRFSCLSHKCPAQTYHHCIPQANSPPTSLIGRKGGNCLLSIFS